MKISQLEKENIIRHFIGKDGRLKTIPAKFKKKLILLEHMLTGLEENIVYEEREINAHIQSFHDDFATIRRAWVETGFMERKEGRYTLVSPAKRPAFLMKLIRWMSNSFF